MDVKPSISVPIDYIATMKIQPTILHDSHALDISQASHTPLTDDDLKLATNSDYQTQLCLQANQQVIRLEGEEEKSLPTTHNISAAILPILQNAEPRRQTVLGIPVDRQDSRNFQPLTIEELRKRRLQWTLKRLGRAFIQFNLCYMFSLLVVVIYNVLQFVKYRPICRELAVAFVYYIIAGVSSISLGFVAIYTIIKNAGHLIKYYIGGQVASLLMLMFIIIYQSVDDADTDICLRIDDVSVRLIIISVVTAVVQVMLICFTIRVMQLIHETQGRL